MCFVLSSQVNTLVRTYHGIDVCGTRLVKEVKEFINKYQDEEKKSITAISFVGTSARPERFDGVGGGGRGSPVVLMPIGSPPHRKVGVCHALLRCQSRRYVLPFGAFSLPVGLPSMPSKPVLSVPTPLMCCPHSRSLGCVHAGYSAGGLFNRYAAGLLHREGFFASVRPLCFITIATPHLGCRELPHSAGQRLRNGFMATVSNFYCGRSGQQVCGGARFSYYIYCVKFWCGR